MFVLRDIALIILALEGALFTLLILLVLGVINYGIFRSRWWHVLPKWFALGRGYLGLGKYYVERACEAVSAPVIAAVTTGAGVAEGARHLVELGRETIKRPTGDATIEQGDEE